MPREIITIECTEARKEGKSPSRYTTTRNKKTKTEKLEIKKYNPFVVTRSTKKSSNLVCLARLTQIGRIGANRP
jgi:large subunit ribosomal protein L33